MKIPTIGLSTCWLSHRHSDGYEMLKEIADLGFEWVELSHGIRPFLVEGIERAVKEGLVRIISVHNFCPLPGSATVASPNYYEPCAPRRAERNLWLRHTRDTLEFAAKVQAQYCVLHSGSIRSLRSKMVPALNQGFQQKGEGLGRFKNEQQHLYHLQELMKQLRHEVPIYLKRLRQSLRQILPLAREYGIRIGLENRESLLELPLDSEMDEILEDWDKADLVGYWHDFGHAQIKELRGVIRHKQLLKHNEGRLFGFHVHDVSKNGKDHQALGSGVINFEALSPFFQIGHPLILELSPEVKKEAVVASHHFLYELTRFN